MTKKVYRTAQGRMVDLGSLQLQNENVRAVGNMNVNARGDLIDGWNKPVEPRNKQVARQYNKQTTNVSQESLNQRGRAPNAKSVVKPDIPTPPEDFDDNFVKPQSTTPEATESSGGLAAAIAKARKIQQPLIDKTDNKGIKKI